MFPSRAHLTRAGRTADEKSQKTDRHRSVSQTAREWPSVPLGSCSGLAPRRVGGAISRRVGGAISRRVEKAIERRLAMLHFHLKSGKQMLKLLFMNKKNII